MNLEGYGCIVGDKPRGIWPVPLSEARKMAAHYPGARIVEVWTGNSVSLSEPTPLFKPEPASA